MISTAVNLQQVSAISGYQVKLTLAGLQAGVNPQLIVVIGQKSAANETSVVSKLDATTATEVGKEYGYNSPLYAAARILRPISGNKLGSIPTWFIPVAEASGATAKVITYSTTGTPTKTVTHYLKINGRSYGYVVAKDATAAQISQAMIDAANNALGSTVIGTLSTDDAVFTAGWKGVSSNEINIEIDTNGNSAGLTYSEVVADGAGAAAASDVQAALALIGDAWATLVVNCFGSESGVLNELETFNGNPNDAIGRYEPTLFKPFISFFGDSKIKYLNESSGGAGDGFVQMIGSRSTECTNAFCPSPGSLGLGMEAAANRVFSYAPILQNTPHQDALKTGIPDPDMPYEEGADIGDFADPVKRDLLVKAGCSTVTVLGGKYKTIDFVTTYSPEDEPDTATLFRWVRDIAGCHWNYKYVSKLLKEIYQEGNTITDDGEEELVGVDNTISPSQWKTIMLMEYAPALISNALMVDFDHFKDSLQVARGDSNPNRMEDAFSTKIPGVVRVSSTTNNAVFNFNN